MEVEYQGMKFSGGKFFIILSLIGAIVGGGWSGYKFYDDYLTMKQQVLEYTAPDLSHYDEQIAVIKSELDMILDAKEASDPCGRKHSSFSKLRPGR